MEFTKYRPTIRNRLEIKGGERAFMEWPRAKNILIVLFLSLNILLAYNIFINNYRYEVSRQTKLDAIAGRGITLACKLPDNFKKAPKLEFEGNDNYDELNKKHPGIFKETPTGILFYKAIGQSNERPEGFPNIRDVSAYAEKYLIDFGFPFEDYYLESYSSDGNNSINLRFIEKYRGYLIFDNYIEVKVDRAGVTYIEARYNLVKGLSESSHDIIQPLDAILSGLSIIGNVKVESVALGYRSISDEGKMEKGDRRPVWGIKTSQSSERSFIQAFDNASQEK